jgi:hypothetical protein
MYGTYSTVATLVFAIYHFDKVAHLHTSMSPSERNLNQGLETGGRLLGHLIGDFYVVSEVGCIGIIKFLDFSTAFAFALANMRTGGLNNPVMYTILLLGSFRFVWHLYFSSSYPVGNKLAFFKTLAFQLFQKQESDVFLPKSGLSPGIDLYTW